MSEPTYRRSWLQTTYDQRVRALLDLALGPYRNPDDVDGAPLADLAMLLGQNRFAERSEREVLMHLRSPGTGPFWMMQLVMVMYGGAERLSEPIRAEIASSWATVRQLRGDTENHWVLFHTTLYLAAQAFPEGVRFENGLTAEENTAEAVDWLTHWIHGAVRLGQSEYNPTHYIAEYATPLLMLSLWARGHGLAERARMMLDHLFAELATVSLAGVLRGPHSRTDDISVVERWNSMSSLYSWLLFGTTQPATARNGFWNGALAQLAHGYQPPEVIRRIAVDPAPVRLQRDRARSRRMIRRSEVEFRPILKAHYLRPEYAVGSMQGGLSDAIQGHAWDVTWHEPDPRGKQPTLFSAHPHHTGPVLQTFFSCAPEPMAASVPFEGKPSFGEHDSLVGVSVYEQVVQDRDTVVALYAVPADDRTPHVNTFISRDLRELTVADSGWIVARGGDAFVALLPLSDYDWAEHRSWPNPWDPTTSELTGSRLLISRGGFTGTVVQVASAAEFADLDVFRSAVEAAPLEFGLDPCPWVRLTSIRGTRIEVEHGRDARVDGVPVRAEDWQLFEGTHLFSALRSGIVSIRHGGLERILDFATLTTTDIDHDSV